MTEKTRATLPSKGAIRAIEVTGWSLFVVWAGGLIAWAVAYPDPYASAWRLVLELAFVGGRAVNIADGVASGFSRTFLLFQCGLQDVVYTLIIYPWIVRVYHGVSRVGFVGRVIESLRESAERNSRIIEPLGGLGLWAFVFFPFWSTGVLNGAALGFVLGMRTSVNLTIVLSSHIASVIALLLFFETVSSAMGAVDQGTLRYMPWIVLAVLAALAIVQRVVVRLRSR